MTQDMAAATSLVSGTYTTMGDIKKLLADMLISSEPDVSFLAARLQRPHTRVGLTLKSLEDVDDAVLVHKFESPALLLGTVGYQFASPADFGSKSGRIPLRQAIQGGKPVNLRITENGPELYFDVAQEDAVMPYAAVITIVIGTYRGSDIIMDWIPGGPLRPLAVPGSTEILLHPNTAVFLYR
jgi:hypothetical protein